MIIMVITSFINLNVFVAAEEQEEEESLLYFLFRTLSS